MEELDQARPWPPLQRKSGGERRIAYGCSMGLARRDSRGRHGGVAANRARTRPALRRRIPPSKESQQARQPAARCPGCAARKADRARADREVREWPADRITGGRPDVGLPYGRIPRALSGTSEREKCILQELGVFEPQAGTVCVTGEDAAAARRVVNAIRHEQTVAAMNHLMQEGTAIFTQSVRVQGGEPPLNAKNAFCKNWACSSRRRGRFASPEKMLPLPGGS